MPIENTYSPTATLLHIRGMHGRLARILMPKHRHANINIYKKVYDAICLTIRDMSQ